jgi:hypothetical protein
MKQQDLDALRAILAAYDRMEAALREYAEAKNWTQSWYRENVGPVGAFDEFVLWHLGGEAGADIGFAQVVTDKQTPQASFLVGDDDDDFFDHAFGVGFEEQGRHDDGDRRRIRASAKRNGAVGRFGQDRGMGDGFQSLAGVEIGKDDVGECGAVE